MAHGTHCYCMVCKVGKSLGLVEVCTSGSCAKCGKGTVKKLAAKKAVRAVKKATKRGKK